MVTGAAIVSNKKYLYLVFLAIFTMTPPAAIPQSAKYIDLNSIFVVDTDCTSSDLTGKSIPNGSYNAEFIPAQRDGLGILTVEFDDNCFYKFYGHRIVIPLKSVAESRDDIVPVLGFNVRLMDLVREEKEKFNLSEDKLFYFTMASRDPVNPEFDAFISAAFYNGILIGASVSSMDEKMRSIETFMAPDGFNKCCR